MLFTHTKFIKRAIHRLVYSNALHTNNCKGTLCKKETLFCGNLVIK